MKVDITVSSHTQTVLGWVYLKVIIAPLKLMIANSRRDLTLTYRILYVFFYRSASPFSNSGSNCHSNLLCSWFTWARSCSSCHAACVHCHESLQNSVGFVAEQCDRNTLPPRCQKTSARDTGKWSRRDIGDRPHETEWRWGAMERSRVRPPVTCWRSSGGAAALYKMLAKQEFP